MKRNKSEFSWIPRDNFAVGISGLAIFSAASVIFSASFRDITLAIVGSLGLAVVAVGLGIWASGHQVRRVVSDLRNAGSVAWPVYAQSDRDRRHRRGYVEADEIAVAITIKTETIRLKWSEVASLTLQAGGRFKNGRVLIKVPTRGTLILEILSSDAVSSLKDSQLLDCTETLNEFKLASVSRKHRTTQ
jgi:hypothetical protein